MRKPKDIKGVFLFLSLLYLTFYLPMTGIIYLPQWFRVNCNWHPRCESIGYGAAFRGIDELNAYFLHQGELVNLWSDKEKVHLAEVRGMFDTMFYTAVFAAAVIFPTFDKKRVSRYAFINAAIILSLLVVLPFFSSFWKDFFHPLLFDNELWKNNPSDLSYYIMPRTFFKYTVALLIVVCCILNLTLRFAFRHKSANSPVRPA